MPLSRSAVVRLQGLGISSVHSLLATGSSAGYFPPSSYSSRETRQEGRKNPSGQMPEEWPEEHASNELGAVAVAAGLGAATVC